MPSSAQHGFNQVYRSDQNQLLGTYFGSVVATDSSYYLSGLTVKTSPIIHNIGLFSKLDSNGFRVFQNTYGDTAKPTEMWNAGLIATNNGFLVKTGLHRDGSIFLIKINPKNGEVVFLKNYYPSPLGNRLLTHGGLSQTHDKGWLISARESRGFHHLLVLIKTDSTGSETDRWEYDQPLYDYQSGKVLSELDGGFIISSYRTKGNRDIDSAYKMQTQIFKIDSLGRILWQYFTSESRRLTCIHIAKTKDGGLILAGRESFQEIQNNGIIRYEWRGFIRKLNLHRQLLWERKLGIIGDSYFNKVVLRDNNIYAFGQNNSPDTTFWGAWMVKMDEDSGFVDYERVIGSDIVPSIPKFNFLIDATSTPDHGFLFCGYIDVLCQVGDSCRQWAWVVKLDSMGCAIPGCHTVGIEDTFPQYSSIQVFPNPAQDQITFQWQTYHHFEKLLIYDTQGKERHRLAIDPNKKGYDLPLYDLPDGLYIYHLETIDGERVSGKFVKH